AAPVSTMNRQGCTLWWLGACAPASSSFSIILRGSGSGLHLPMDMRVRIASNNSIVGSFLLNQVSVMISLPETRYGAGSKAACAIPCFRCFRSGRERPVKVPVERRQVIHVGRVARVLDDHLAIAAARRRVSLQHGARLAEHGLRRVEVLSR